MTQASAEPFLDALQPGCVAVVTGAASGIGRAAARRFARLGLRVVMVDKADSALADAAAEVASLAKGGAGDVRTASIDVADPAAMRDLHDTTLAAFGEVAVLMNNAANNHNPGKSWTGLDGWKRVMDVNFWGVVHGVQAFMPSMLEAGKPGLVINTGSKQGITSPPGNIAHNVSKASLKVFTEGLAHELRTTPGCRITAHLLIPGFTFTGMTPQPEKPPGAWTPDQVIDFMLAGLARGDFYILCPDNEVTRATDERRIQWAADDLIRNRPALSRWHPDHAEEYRRFME